MKPDELEQKLQRQPLRQLPAEWRDEILSAAQRTSASHHSSRVTHHSAWWRELFWPAPRAWAGLAAVWVVILALHFATQEKPTAIEAHRRAATPTESLRKLREREALLAELVELPQPAATDAPKAVPPRPRSNRRDEFLNA